MRRWCGWLCAVLAASALGVSAQEAPRPALQVVEQASQEGFPFERPFLDGKGRRLQAAGVHLRVRDGAKLYALCLYVDIARLSALTRGRPRTPEALADLLIRGQVAHAFVSRFVEPLPQANRMRFLLGHLRTYWPDGKFDPDRPTLRRFLAFFDRPVARGVETQVWIDPRGSIATRAVGGRARRTHDPQLCTAFSASYLGAAPMDPALKEDLLRELPAVIEMIEVLQRPVVEAP